MPAFAMILGVGAVLWKAEEIAFELHALRIRVQSNSAITYETKPEKRRVHSMRITTVRGCKYSVPSTLNSFVSQDCQVKWHETARTADYCEHIFVMVPELLCCFCLPALEQVLLRQKAAVCRGPVSLSTVGDYS